jgi:hypothetical protein
MTTKENPPGFRGSVVIRRPPSLTSACAALLIGFASTPAHAEIGACRPDALGGLTCGEGVGAARVVAGTISPSQRFAVAWRSTKADPLDAESASNGYDLEDMVIRLADGAVLARTEGSYFEIGPMQANRAAQTGSWSPDSHYLVETVEDRWSTNRFDLYAIEAGDTLIGPIDLLKIVLPAARARLARSGEKPDHYELQLDENPHTGKPLVSVDKHGVVRAQAWMHVVHGDDEATYDLALQVVQKGPSLGARLISLTRARKERY